MAIWQGRPKRKSSGGRLRLARKKRKFEVGREKQFTRLGVRKVKMYRVKGANTKARLLLIDSANVVDPKTNAIKKVKILTVKTNPSNPNYVQRNIMTKGATVMTELGEAVITSRCGQDGVVNAVLLGSAEPKTP
ncbi:MAG: 30S ribosomal protein S8e [Euryarchaeota archaeon RBG_13_57_23]|nr:MAG: 30S ribosomal protein S8e [Candidatus Bathyarchaeota archaeon RBG_16_57_9]OGS44829.1 MAG: 30S ribosomal protein S8e [Euryarchaeota archaeon RBG_13_57_23]